MRTMATGMTLLFWALGRMTSDRASAASVTWLIEGWVRFVFAELPEALDRGNSLGITPGAAVSARLTLNPEVPDSEPLHTPIYADYSGALKEVDLSIGSLVEHMVIGYRDQEVSVSPGALPSTILI